MASMLKYLPLALNSQSWRHALDDIRLVSALMADPRVPLQAKAVPGLAAAYLISPLDLIPAFIPVLGQLDDLAVMLLAVQTFKRMVPAELLAEHQRRLGIATGHPIIDRP